MLELQKYLRDPANKPSDLTAKYGIAVKRHPEYPNLVMFKYSQIESPMGERIVQECRGIILDEKADWAVVNLSFFKFFNHGEGHAAPIDWAHAAVQEKLDGSLCQLYFYDGKWRVASSGMPDAGGVVYGFTLTFKELFWKVWEEKKYSLPDESCQKMCFAFELMTPYNKQVVQHKENRLVLHGAREMSADTVGGDYPEVSPEFWGKTLGYEVVKSYPLTTLDEVLKSLEFIPATEGEGYVVCDSNFNRIKIKTPQYVALHHMRDGMGSKRMLEVIRSNESEEFLTYFPEFRSLHAQIKEKYVVLVGQLDGTWDRFKNMPTGDSPDEQKLARKNFALAIKDIPLNGVLFGLRNGHFETAKQGLREMNIKHLMEALKIKEMVIEI